MKVNLGGVEFARESISHDEKFDFLHRGEWDYNPEIVAVLAGVIEQILSVKCALNEAVAVFDHNTTPQERSPLRRTMQSVSLLSMHSTSPQACASAMYWYRVGHSNLVFHSGQTSAKLLTRRLSCMSLLPL